MQSVTDQSCWDLRGPFPMSFANSPKRTCRPHSGNLDNRHVEIVCAASARVNVSVLYQFVDTANWPLLASPRGGFPSVGQRVARSLPERWPAVLPRGDMRYGSRPSARAQGRGSLVAAPF